MKKLITMAAIAALSITIGSGISQAQIVTPSPSPLGKVEQRVGVTDITLTYSRPSVKGRKVFGELLAFGEIWRFGANAPTKIKFADSVKVGGHDLAPGEYAVYATPGQTEWTIYFGKDTKVQADAFDKEKAAAKLTVKPETTASNTETFTLQFGDITTNSTNLTMAWEKTMVKIPITTEVDKRVMASINSTLTDIGPYWAAANYYYESDRDLKQALEWTEKTIAKDPAFYRIHLKAKILKKMGDCKGATAAAELSKTKSVEAKNKAYTDMNDKIIADCKGKK
ncbi:MAG: DUF2911 domain-containing protein [Bacteroidota bacterium]